MAVFSPAAWMPLGRCAAQRLSWPSIDMAISASQGGGSTGVLRIKNFGPSCAPGKTLPFTYKWIRTSAEWPKGLVDDAFMSNPPEFLRRAQKYCEAKGLILGDSLGSGVHGNVFAVRVFLVDVNPGNISFGEWSFLPLRPG
jgi:hypothetical protein